MLQISNLTIYKRKNILSIEVAVREIKKLRAQGKKIGLCHGGFDLLHPGHIKHFESAKKKCDILFVSVTMDAFVASRKGDGRPIFPENLRTYMIASLRDVDYVVVSRQKTSVEIIQKLKPDLYIKGPDFIGKQTPGWKAESMTIQSVGGRTICTTDLPISTTSIIRYIQRSVDSRQFLIIIDRDGTLIENDKFFGNKNGWKKNLKYNKHLINFLAYIKTKYQCTMIVVSNQSGVARKYFTEKRVKDINKTIASYLTTQGISIKSWQYCPDVDRKYTGKHPKVIWAKKYVKSQTQRKPNITMVTNALKNLNMSLTDFSGILVIGNSQDDQLLAKNVTGHFLSVNAEQTFQSMRNATRDFFERSR